MRLRKAALVLFGAASLMMAVPTVASADPGNGNSDAAQLCQKGGYQDVVGTDGPFKNAGDCTSYAARGGTFYALHPTLQAWNDRSGSYWHCTSWNWWTGACNGWSYVQSSVVRYSGSGWVPGSQETGTLVVTGFGTYSRTAVAGSSGAFSGYSSSFPSFGNTFTLTLSNSLGQSATVSGTT